MLFVIVIAMTILSIIGIFNSSKMYPIEELRNKFIPTDIINVFLILPLIILSIVLTFKGYYIGLIFWIGSLFVICYHYIAYTVANTLSFKFIIFLLILILTIIAIVKLIKNIKIYELKTILQDSLPAKFVSFVLIGLGLIFLLRSISIIYKTYTLDSSLPSTEIADFAFSIFWIISGILLLLKKGSGYLLSSASIVQATVLFIGLMIYFILQPIIFNNPFALEDFIFIFIMSWICFLPFIIFIRRILIKSK